MLYEHALEHPGAKVGVLVDGPYGGIALDKFQDVDHVLLVAGGSGAGWCLPFIERYVKQSARGEVVHKANRGDVQVESKALSGPVSLRVVLATRDTASRRWFLGAVDEILAKHTAESVSGLNVQVYLTGNAAHDASEKLAESAPTPTGSTSPIDEIEVPKPDHVGHIPGREHNGRPRLSSIVAEEAGKVKEGGQSLSAFVCGPYTMQNDVRNAVAAENLRSMKGSSAGSVYLHSEHFSWA